MIRRHFRLDPKARNAVVQNGILDAGVASIGKPFTVEERAAKMRGSARSPVLEPKRLVFVPCGAGGLD